MGTQAQTTTVTIPTSAKVGYNFEIQMYRPEAWSRLSLAFHFQVCTLKSSKTTVSSGGAVRLSGVVPIAGHWGSTPGTKKYVTIYKRSTSAGVPQTWSAKGWTKVGVYRTNGYGAYHTGYLRPTRNTWYVARYPGRDTPGYSGDSYYSEGFTGVRKVTVRR